MALNYIQAGDQALTTIAPVGGVTKGVPLKLSATAVKIVIPLQTKAAGLEVECATEGVYEIDKEAPLAIGQYDPIYWDNTAKKGTTTATNNTLMGHAAYPAASNATKVQVRLTP